MCESLSRFRIFATPWTVAHQRPHPWNSPGKNMGVGCHFLLQGIFPTQGSNMGFLHCRQTLFLFEPPRKPIDHTYSRQKRKIECKIKVDGAVHYVKKAKALSEQRPSKNSCLCFIGQNSVTWPPTVSRQSKNVLASQLL